MNIGTFTSQVIREICEGAIAVNSSPPSTVEIDAAITSDGDVCGIGASCGRVRYSVRVMWPNDPSSATGANDNNERKTR